MPKVKSKPILNLNLLKPQSNPEKLPVKLIRWLLVSGKYIFVFVEAIVLIAFAARFKLDADIAEKKEAIEEQIPYIESLNAYEVLIRQTQMKLAFIDNIKTNSLDWAAVLQKIASQTPTSIKINTINVENKLNVASIHITGQTPANNDLLNFISGLKEEGSFNNVNLTSVGLEEGIIKFTVDASVNAMNLKTKSL